MVTGATKRAVRADERARADVRPVFAEAVVIAGDRAGADIGLLANGRIADIGQVIGLGALAEVGLLHLDEIADLGVLAEPRPGRSRANGPTSRPSPIVAPSIWLKARIVAPSAISTPGPKTTCGSISHVAAELRVVGEPDGFRVDQGRALVQRLLAPAALPFDLEVSELGAAVDAGGLVTGRPR